MQVHEASLPMNAGPDGCCTAWATCSTDFWRPIGSFHTREPCGGGTTRHFCALARGYARAAVGVKLFQNPCCLVDSLLAVVRVQQPCWYRGRRSRWWNGRRRRCHDDHCWRRWRCWRRRACCDDSLRCECFVQLPRNFSPDCSRTDHTHHGGNGLLLPSEAPDKQRDQNDCQQHTACGRTPQRFSFLGAQDSAQF